MKLLLPIVVLVLLLGAAPAAADDVLIESDPCDGATLATAPSAIFLTFNGDPPGS